MENLSKISNINVSVVLITYNGEKYIREQLESILKQTVMPNEIIISDDSSTDDTYLILKNYETLYPDFVNLYKNNINVGFLKNIELALSKSNGDIIFLCDQDDIWEKNKVECFLRQINLHPDKNVFFSNAEIIDEFGKFKGTKWYSKNYFKKFNEKKLKNDILARQMIPLGSSMAITKNFYNSIIPFCEYCAHDTWISLCSLINNDLFYFDDCLLRYRRHSNNLSSKKNTNISFESHFGGPRNRFLTYELFLNRNKKNLSKRNRKMLRKYIKFYVYLSKIKSKSIHNCFIILQLYFFGKYRKLRGNFKTVLSDIRFILNFKE